MSGPLPIVLVPGLNCSARLYAEQIPALWRFGPVTIADHRRDDTVAAIAARILATAPPRFALVGLSMGGYIAFAIARAGAGAGGAARVARYLGAPRHGRAERAPAWDDRARRGWAVLRGARPVVPRVCASQSAGRRGAAGDRAHHGRGNRAAGFRAPAACDHDAPGLPPAALRRSVVRHLCWWVTATS